MLWRPLLALQPKSRSRTFERHLPTQGGRIETYMELARRREQPCGYMTIVRRDVKLDAMGMMRRCVPR